MNPLDLIGFLLAAAVAVYLVIALIRAESF